MVWQGCRENADLQKKKKRRTRGLKFITLASKGCFCVCDTSVFSRSLFARSAFSRPAFSSSRHRRVTNTKTAFARERNEFKSLSSFLFFLEVCVFEVCGLRFRGLRFRDTLAKPSIQFWWNNYSETIATNWHQRPLEACHVNSTFAPLNLDDGSILPDTYLHLIDKLRINTD